MQIKQHIARRYAQAFFRQFGSQAACRDLAALKQAQEFLHTHPQFISLLKLPHLADELKISAIQKLLLDRFGLATDFLALIKLLALHKRLHLIEKVLAQLLVVYHKECNVEHFVISSSGPLKTEEKNWIHMFLAKRLGHDIIEEYKEDKGLIAGIRMQSMFHLWEYSIAKQCALLKRQWADT